MAGFNTKSIHSGRKNDVYFSGPSYPIYLSSTYTQNSIEDFGEFMYSRSGNPTRDHLEKLVADLEEANYCLATSSGMAATSVALSFLVPGDKILINNNVYGGTWTYVSQILQSKGILFEVIDNFNELSVEDLTDDINAVYIETPSNPLLEVVDIERLSSILSGTSIKLIVDNTFMTSYLQKPLALGADIVVYSATKYYGGHSDLIAGLLLVNDEELYNDFKLSRKLMGSPLAPFDSFLLTRGIKTLPIRIDRQEINTKKLVEFLSGHDAVDRIYYTGLEGTENYSIQTKQAKGFGSVISFELNENFDMNEFCKSLSVFELAVSLGGIESLVCIPSRMTHEDYSRELMDKIGIKQNLIRVAIGIENIENLIEDFDFALNKSKK